jgi:hypothetical protein
VVLPGGRAAYLELKSPTGSLSPAQREFRAARLAAGALHEVARTIDQAIEVLRGWGAVRVSCKSRAA